ncbi:MAG: orotate phosphoribosyltransferase [Candidatus Delongbacteria bacterium]
MTPLDMLLESRALLEGHFLLTSGRHSPNYFQCALVLQHPVYARTLCGLLAESFRALEPQSVIAPAVGGIVVAVETGRQLGVPARFAERQEGRMTLRRGFQLEPGERVLVVEDVVTTGGSVQEVIDLVAAAGAVPVGVGVIVDRSAGRTCFIHQGRALHLAACHTQDVVSYAADDCPLCRMGSVPIKPGSRGLA